MDPQRRARTDRAPRAGDQPPRGRALTAVPATILVVEADRAAGARLAERLIADGYRVELAGSAEHARMLARIAAPDALLLGDLGAPRTALALLEEVRSAPPGSPWASAVPAIVLGAGRHELEL